MSEPEWTQRGKSFGMWRDDKAADDQAKQEPGSSSGKEMAKGFKHLVQVKQSRHTVPLLNGVIRETYRMSAPSNWPPPSACWAECRVLRRGTSELTTQEFYTTSTCCCLRSAILFRFDSVAQWCLCDTGVQVKKI